MLNMNNIKYIMWALHIIQYMHDNMLKKHSFSKGGGGGFGSMEDSKGAGQ